MRRRRKKCTETRVSTRIETDRDRTARQSKRATTRTQTRKRNEHVIEQDPPQRGAPNIPKRDLTQPVLQRQRPPPPFRPSPFLPLPFALSPPPSPSGTLGDETLSPGRWAIQRASGSVRPHRALCLALGASTRIGRPDPIRGDRSSAAADTERPDRARSAAAERPAARWARAARPILRQRHPRAEGWHALRTPPPPPPPRHQLGPRPSRSPRYLRDGGGARRDAKHRARCCSTITRTSQDRHVAGALGSGAAKEGRKDAAVREGGGGDRGRDGRWSAGSSVTGRGARSRAATQGSAARHELRSSSLGRVPLDGGGDGGSQLLNAAGRLALATARGRGRGGAHPAQHIASVMERMLRRGVVRHRSRTCYGAVQRERAGLRPSGPNGTERGARPSARGRTARAPTSEKRGRARGKGSGAGEGGGHRIPPPPREVQVGAGRSRAAIREAGAPRSQR